MSAQQDIIKKYGQPGAAYQSKFCTLWQVQQDFPWFPAKRIFINKDFKEKLAIALKSIEQAGLQEEIITFDGCYMERKVRGSSKISLHSWGMACDFNSNQERLGQKETKWTPKFIELMKAAGLFWGGDYQTRKDNMHFSLYNG